MLAAARIRCASSPLGGASRRWLVCAGVSLLGHAPFALPWLLRAPHEALPAPSREQLIVELAGLVGDRQVEELHARAAPSVSALATAAAPDATPPRALGPAARDIPVHVRPPLAVDEHPSTALVPAPVADHVRAEPAVAVRDEGRAAPSEPGPATSSSGPIAPPPPSSVPATGPGEAAQDQLQRTVARADKSDGNAVGKYLVRLRKAILARFEYPSRAGYAGSPVIRFTVASSGDILPGTLAIQRSSGQALLDDNALRAARASSPLPPPPHQMNVAIELAVVSEP